jgi:hypothetical protein
MRFNYVANLIVNANHSIMSATAKLCVADCVADAHRDDSQRFIVRADEKLTAFVELESAILGCASKDQVESPLARASTSNNGVTFAV